MARRSLADIMDGEADLDVETLAATTDADIRRYKAEDGFADMPFGPARPVLTAAEVRGRLGLTQAAFARALQIPVATLRNWEQNRKLPDPAARSLLNAVAREPEAVLRALGSPVTEPAKRVSR